MSYAKQLTNLAFATEQSLGKLVDEQVEENTKTRALDELEAAWDEARADGVVDEREAKGLRTLAEAAGIDDLARGETLSGAALEAAENELKKSLREARFENTRGSNARQLLLQLGMSEMKSLYESASAASRTEHQTYMTVIGNLKA